MAAVADTISVFEIPFALGMFGVGAVTLIFGAVARWDLALRTGSKLMASAVVAIPFLAAVARLVHSPLPPDASILLRAIDTFVEVVMIALGIAALAWIRRVGSRSAGLANDSRTGDINER